MADRRPKPEPERILAQIERTRDDLDGTLDALGERLSPERLIDSVRRLTGRMVAASPVATVVAALLVGAVLGRTASRRR